MQRTDLRAGGYTLYLIVLWALVLPEGIVYAQTSRWVPLWRPMPMPVLGVVALAAGTALALAAGRSLAEQGIGLLGAKPGPALVDGGLYAILRHPMDVGAVLLASAPALAVGVRQVWIVPVAAITYFVAGFEPLEERRLLEEFGDDYRAYRRVVPRWFPTGKETPDSGA